MINACRNQSQLKKEDFLVTAITATTAIVAMHAHDTISKTCKVRI